MEVETLVWIIVVLALLVIGILFVTGSWDRLGDLFDKIKGVSVLG